MAEKPKRAAPPYATFASLLTFINKLREKQIPSRIDPSVFGNASGSLSYSIIAALKSLKLISANGTPTQEFVTLVKANDEDRKPLMQHILRVGYPSLWSGAIDLSAATAGQFDEHIRAEYEAKGSTVDKVAAFFIAAAKFADLPISPHLAARKPTSSSATSAKSKRQRKIDDGRNGDASLPAIPPAGQGVITDKALEYKLIDLMRDDGIDDTQREAIWTLVRYLTAKHKIEAPDQG